VGVPAVLLEPAQRRANLQQPAPERPDLDRAARGVWRAKRRRLDGAPDLNRCERNEQNGAHSRHVSMARRTDAGDQRSPRAASADSRSVMPPHAFGDAIDVPFMSWRPRHFLDTS